MDFSLLEHFPEPIFFIRGGKIEYRNSAAAKLAPEWTAGCAVPAELALEPDEEGVFSCVLAGREFQAAVTRGQDGVLLVLRSAVKLPESAVLATLPIQLRELTNNVQAAAGMLESGGDKEEEKRKYLAVLTQNFYRLLRLARHLEMAERAGKEQAVHKVEDSIDLANLCREVGYSAAELARRAQVNFTYEVPGGVILSRGDSELLEIMLLELISNALKAAGAGGEAGLRVSANGNRVLIAVWDNGPGMSQAELTAVMDGSSSESLPKPGTGLRLGLPIARYAAAAHGGAVLLESREGKGLCCTVSLPLKKPIKGKMGTPRKKSEQGESSLMTFLSDALPWQVFDE